MRERSEIEAECEAFSKDSSVDYGSRLQLAVIAELLLDIREQNAESLKLHREARAQMDALARAQRPDVFEEAPAPQRAPRSVRHSSEPLSDTVARIQSRHSGEAKIADSEVEHLPVADGKPACRYQGDVARRVTRVSCPECEKRRIESFLADPGWYLTVMSNHGASVAETVRRDIEAAVRAGVVKNVTPY